LIKIQSKKYFFTFLIMEDTVAPAAPMIELVIDFVM